MNERLLELRKALGLTQAKFGEKINLKSNSITALEKGSRTITERTIADICREYNVNETWLREGTGSMFRPVKSDESLFAEQAAKLIKSKDPVTIKAVAFLLKLINDGEDELKDAYIKFIHDSHKAIMEMEEYKNK
ncbi:MAG: helix-turn-helix transcriptional regulator [Clostridia bacterium]|nr:helix-turn-helix transcriptional regulator [Clostridia bacterium]